MSKTREPEQNNLAPPNSVAEYIHAAESRVSSLIHRHFRFLTWSTVGAVALLLGVYAAATFITRAPADLELLDRLGESNQNLSAIATALLREPPGGSAPARALEAVVAQAEIHRQALSEIRKRQAEPSPDIQSVIQIVGGAAVLTLLGILGLQRLQNIDTEVNNLRESVHNQLQARIRDTEKVLAATIDDEVEGKFSQMEEKYRHLFQEADALKKQFQQLAEESEQKLKQVAEPVMAAYKTYEEKQVITPGLERFPGKLAIPVAEVASVEQAHRLAVSFNAEGDRLAAREALSQIVARNLPGEPDDFHNAHTEAMRMEEVQLALDIVEAGLKFFPDHYELVPDKVRVLQSVGKAEEARGTIEQWIKNKPHEFTRSWRGAVFYADLFDALEMTEEAAERVELALRLAVEKLPREVKPANALARFYQRLGREEEAIKVFQDALRKNPFSQQLNYNLGEMYLRGGDVSNALAYLEKALWLDYQEQYQHDVNQHAVRATLAQAYEAAGELEKAELLYRSVVDEGPAERTIVTYCRNRLAAIALRQGKLPRPNDGADAAAQVAQLLREAIGERANVAQTGE